MAAASKTCSCLVERLPSDKVIEAQTILLPSPEKNRVLADDIEWWLDHEEARKTVLDCRFLGCAGRGYSTSDCEFDAGLYAQRRHDYVSAIRWYSRVLGSYPDDATTLEIEDERIWMLVSMI